MTGPWVKQGDGATGGIFRLACHNKPSMFINYKKSLIAATGEGVKNQARMSGFALCKGTVDKQVLQKDDRPGGGTLAGLGGTRGRNEEGGLPCLTSRLPQQLVDGSILTESDTDRHGDSRKKSRPRSRSFTVHSHSGKPSARAAKDRAGPEELREPALNRGGK